MTIPLLAMLTLVHCFMFAVRDAFNVGYAYTHDTCTITLTIQYNLGSGPPQ